MHITKVGISILVNVLYELCRHDAFIPEFIKKNKMLVLPIAKSIRKLTEIAEVKSTARVYFSAANFCPHHHHHCNAPKDHVPP